MRVPAAVKENHMSGFFSGLFLVDTGLEILRCIHACWESDTISHLLIMSVVFPLQSFKIRPYPFIIKI